MSTRSLSSCAKFCGWGSCLNILSISSHRTKCQVQSSQADAMPLHHPLCCSGSEGWYYFASKLFLDLLYCVRLPLVEECGFDPSQQTSFGEVFVCIIFPPISLLGHHQIAPFFLQIIVRLPSAIHTVPSILSLQTESAGPTQPQSAQVYLR